ncbi:hypothetical protein JCM15415_06370 [Methanobacterium movens]
MYGVIIGAGGLGLNLAKLLTADGHDVTLIEKDKTTCENAALEVDSLVICGDGTDPHTLEEANIKTADVFIAATRMMKRTFYHAYWYVNTKSLKS